MWLNDAILGRPLSSAEAKKEQLSIWTGVPVLGLDALASVGYGPEAALTVLAGMGAAGLRYYPLIAVLIVIVLAALYFSYRQTAEAYPNGGGAYNVTKDNFGSRAALWAAVALLLDYLLNVTVGISAGVGAVVSAIPSLQPHTLLLCLAVLLILTLVNLRGVRESGLVFVVPVFVFVVCLGGVTTLGIVRALSSGGHPHPVISPPPIHGGVADVGLWLLLTAFANGCTAMTGIEAVSNGVPLFREPTVPNAHRALTAIMLILSFLLLGLAYLAPAYQIGGMNEQAPGYQNVLSQLVAAVTGRNVFYYLSLTSIFIVLTYSAQTSFADFPRVCKFLAEDRFLPPTFAKQGRRLVFSEGILVLTSLSALLLIVFRGITDKLIPLFAVGAFSAFLFSQLGMVKHWNRNRGSGSKTKLLVNAFGAVTTAIVLSVVILAKFKEGAWMTVVVAPLAVFFLSAVNNHYRKIRAQVGEQVGLNLGGFNRPKVLVPIKGWNRVGEKAVRFGMILSSDVTALHVSSDGDNNEAMRELWTRNVAGPAEALRSTAPRLEILDSPYRRISQPIIDYVNKTALENPERLVAVVIPQLIEPHWYKYLLHGFYGLVLRTRLFLLANDRIVVVITRWRISDP